MSRHAARLRRERLAALLRKMRLEGGLKQMDVAGRLGRPQSFVSKYEAGERRLDVLELRDVCEAIGVPLTECVRRLEESLSERTP